MRVPLTTSLASRDGSSNKDERMVNCLAEKEDDQVFGAMRPGLTLVANTTGSGKGLVDWNGELIAMYGTTAYSIVYSQNIGVSWSKISGSTILSTSNSPLVAGGSYCLLVISPPNGQVYRTSDGSTWSLLGTSFPGSSLLGVQGFYYAGVFYFYTATTLYSTTDGSSWTTLATLSANDGSGWYIANVNGTFYYYYFRASDSTPKVRISTNLGVSFSAFGTWDGNYDFAAPTAHFYVGSTLYIFDLNGEVDTTTDFLNFTSTGITASDLVTIYHNGLFYGVNQFSGESITYDTSFTRNVISVQTLPSPGPLFGNPYYFGGQEYYSATDGIYQSGIAGFTTIGTVSGTFFDFTQSTT